MKRGLRIAAIVIAALVIVVVAIPFFINVNTFRPELETELTGALGRQVTVGNLSLSIWSGGVSADNIAIADDPAFSKSPFVQAKSLKVGVEMIPLIFSKTLHVTDVTLNEPEVSLVKSENGETWNFSSLGNKNAAGGQSQPASEASKPQPATEPASAPGSANPNVTVAKFNVKEGRVTISRAGSGRAPHVYDKVNVQVTNFGFANSFPFTMTADLPGGGNMKLDGKAGPINATNAALTPLDAKISVQKMNLAESGFIDPASGIAGIADFDGTITSDGHQAKSNGTLQATKLQLAQKGSPSNTTVNVTYVIDQDLLNETGTITQGDVAVGKAVSHLTGTYDLHGPVTVVNLKLEGQGMPVNDLETMLPAVGVVLPPKATLQGGDLNLNLTITGPVDKLVTAGNIRMENSSMANFDLGSKLSSISALGGKKTGNTTEIKNLSSDVRVAPDGTQAKNINLDVPAIGVLTGDGTVSPSNALAFKMKASLGGMGIPFSVEGTTSDPKFVPDVKGMATGLLKGAMGKSGQQNPIKGLSGLLKR